ncbi:MAG: fatty acid desaturase [Gammaproteobacteria bacterium]|nr:fatty acid desaturase [Gammaproteobacteria bacterium]
MFKYSEDRMPVFIILSISVVDFYLYFQLNNPWLLALYWAIMIVPKGKLCAWNHHHQHNYTFKFAALNRLLEFFYALHSGVTTNLWRLHHVLGHHMNYLDQTKDESRWTRSDGSKMGEFEYSFIVAATAYYRGYLVGKSHPKIQREYLLYSALTFLIVGLLIFYKPVAGLFLFALPMISGLLLTAWATYEHHAGLDLKDGFEASNNNVHPFFNLTTGNLGYHTAHHYMQGVHWSKLPALHEQIKDRIPQHLIKASWF